MFAVLPYYVRFYSKSGHRARVAQFSFCDVRTFFYGSALLWWRDCRWHTVGIDPREAKNVGGELDRCLLDKKELVGAAELARHLVAIGIDHGTVPLFARGKREHLEPLNPVVLIGLILGGLGEANSSSRCAHAL